VFAQKSNLGPVLAPYNILHRGRVKLRDGLLLLDVVKKNRTCRAEDEASRAAVEDLVRLNRRFNAPDNSAGHIADLDKLPEMSYIRWRSKLTASLPVLTC